MFMGHVQGQLLGCFLGGCQLTLKDRSGPCLGQHAPHHERMVMGLVCNVLSGASFFVGSTTRENANYPATLSPLLVKVPQFDHSWRWWSLIIQSRNGTIDMILWQYSS